MNLNDLHNPDGIIGIMLHNGTVIEAGPGQAWQEYPGSFELWTVLAPGGQLMRVRRWLKKSIVATAKTPA